MHSPRLLLLTLLLLAALAIVGAAEAAETAPVPLYLSDSLLGTKGKLSPVHPDRDTVRQEKVNDALDQQGNFYPVARWELMLGGEAALGDSYDFQVSVWSTDVQEFKLRAALYVLIEAESYEVANDTATESAQGLNWLNGHYNISLEGNSISTSNLPSEYRDRLPMGTKLGFKLESSVTWAPGIENRTAYVEWDHVDLDSHLVPELRVIYFGPEVEFTNERVDAPGEDSLFIKTNLSDALGENDLVAGSLSLEVSVGGGGSFRGTLRLQDIYIYAKRVEARWFYQDDDAQGGEYSFTFSIRDARGVTWSYTASYELEVDSFELELEPEGETSRQLPGGGKVSFALKVWNRGNARDTVAVALDDRSLPSGWDAALLSEDSFNLSSGDYGYASVRITAPASASGGERGRVTLTVTSQGDPGAVASLELGATVQTYGVTIDALGDEILIDPETLDSESRFRFQVTLRNTGNDRDTYNLDVSLGRSDWRAWIEEGEAQVGEVTIASRDSKVVTVVVSVVNYELGDEVTMQFQAASQPPGDAMAAVDSMLVVKVPLSRLINLRVSPEDLRIEPAEPRAGDDVRVILTVHNEGGLPAGKFTVKLFVGRNVADQLRVDGLDGGAETEVVLVWSEVAGGEHDLKLMVDFGFDIVESDEDDNEVRTTVTVAEGPDGTPGSGGDDGEAGLFEELPGFGLLLLAAVLLGVARRRKS